MFTLPLLCLQGHVVVSDLGLCCQLRKDKLIKHLAGTAGIVVALVTLLSLSCSPANFLDCRLVFLIVLLPRLPS
jgi:hypothetical protein